MGVAGRAQPGIALPAVGGRRGGRGQVRGEEGLQAFGRGVGDGREPQPAAPALAALAGCRRPHRRPPTAGGATAGLAGCAPPTRVSSASTRCASGRAPGGPSPCGSYAASSRRSGSWKSPSAAAAPQPRSRLCSRSPARWRETSAPARSWSARRWCRRAASAACRRPRTRRSAAADGCRPRRGRSPCNRSPRASAGRTEGPALGVGREPRQERGQIPRQLGRDHGGLHVLALFSLPALPPPSTRLSVVES